EAFVRRHRAAGEDLEHVLHRFLLLESMWSIDERDRRKSTARGVERSIACFRHRCERTCKGCSHDPGEALGDGQRFATVAVTTIGFGFSAYLTYRELFSIHAI